MDRRGQEPSASPPPQSSRDDAKKNQTRQGMMAALNALFDQARPVFSQQHTWSRRARWAFPPTCLGRHTLCGLLCAAGSSSATGRPPMVRSSASVWTTMLCGVSLNNFFPSRPLPCSGGIDGRPFAHTTRQTPATSAATPCRSSPALAAADDPSALVSPSERTEQIFLLLVIPSHVHLDVLASLRLRKTDLFRSL